METQSETHSKPSGSIARLIPILAWLPQYNRAWLVADIIAGLTLWGLVVPEGMAYAGIADLPPQAGLYTLVASLLIYALFGSSRHLSVGALLHGGVNHIHGGCPGCNNRGHGSLPGNCGGTGAGDWFHFPGSRIGAPGLGYPVFIQAGHGRICHRTGDFCCRWTA